MDVCSITISGMCLTLFTQNKSRKRDRKESEREAEMQACVNRIDLAHERDSCWPCL